MCIHFSLGHSIMTLLALCLFHFEEEIEQGLLPRGRENEAFRAAVVDDTSTRLSYNDEDVGFV